MGTRGFARDKPRELPASRRARLALALAMSLLLAGCNTGTYPVDVFPEMHYQAWHRPLEPERLTTPPEAVPVTGAPPLLTFALPDTAAFEDVSKIFARLLAGIQSTQVTVTP